MAGRKLTVAEAKAKFAETVRAAETGEPVVITRHGRPVAALVPAADLELLRRLRAAGPEGGLASIAGGWEGSDELADLIDSTPRRGARTRRRRG